MSGQTVPGSKITLTSVNTSETRTTVANETGVLNIIAVRPDTYTLRVEHPGFKASTRSGLTVSANERLALDITLQVGDVTETISVSAEAAQVQTDSSEHSAVLTTTQITNLTARGREVVSMLRTIAGCPISGRSGFAGREIRHRHAEHRRAIATPTSSPSMALSATTMGTPSVFSSVTTLDAIGEVKVLLNSYQAEYAGNGGAVVQVVTKRRQQGVSRQRLRVLRNDALNANDFFNNRNRRPAAALSLQHLRRHHRRADLHPGHWNRSRTKLFGFYNLEQALIPTPGSAEPYTMPTALERQGDFSQTLDVNGKVIPINDTHHRRAVPRQHHPQGPPQPQRPGPDEYPPAAQLLQPRRSAAATITTRSRKSRTGPNAASCSRSIMSRRRQGPALRARQDVDREAAGLRGGRRRHAGRASSRNATASRSPASRWARRTSSAPASSWKSVPACATTARPGIPMAAERDRQGAPLRRSATTSGSGIRSANVNGYIPRFSFGGVPSAPNVSYDNRLLTGGTDFTFNFNDNSDHQPRHARHQDRLATSTAFGSTKASRAFSPGPSTSARIR